MGIFDLFKKGKDSNASIKPTSVSHTTEDMEHLTPEGDLPWGWVTRNKVFVEQIKTEYSYFLNMWLDSRNKSPKEQYSALKSFVLYLEDAEKLCKSKGECFEFWYYEILSSPDYISNRKKDFEKLIENIDEKQADYERRIDLIGNLNETVIIMLHANDNILQSDFIKLFDPIIQNDVRELLYNMEKSGQLIKTKSGRSYTLQLKK